MGIMTRMLRLCKADVHGVMDQLEDKGLLLKQYLREMESSLGYKEQQIRNLTQRINRLTAQIDRHRQEADRIEGDLALALQKEKDDIARMLIRKRRALEAAVMHLDEQVAAASREKSHLAETVAGQRLQYDTLKAKADAWCHRAGDRLFADIARHDADGWESTQVEDEAVELELLQRKEALQKGGAS